jgi:hypothetical protein
MNEDLNEPTVVIFRRSRADRTDIYALMPEVPADVEGLLCESYQHFGEHASADYTRCIATSDPVTPEEYRDLLDEMTQRGYTVFVRQRATPEMHRRRRAEAHRNFLLTQAGHHDDTEPRE